MSIRSSLSRAGGFLLREDLVHRGEDVIDTMQPERLQKLEILSSGAAITLLGVPGSPGQDDPCGGLLPGSPTFRVSVHGDFRSG